MGADAGGRNGTYSLAFEGINFGLSLFIQILVRSCIVGLFIGNKQVGVVIISTGRYANSSETSYSEKKTKKLELGKMVCMSKLEKKI